MHIPSTQMRIFMGFEPKTQRIFFAFIRNIRLISLPINLWGVFIIFHWENQQKAIDLDFLFAKIKQACSMAYLVIFWGIGRRIRTTNKMLSWNALRNCSTKVEKFYRERSQNTYAFRVGGSDLLRTFSKV